MALKIKYAFEYTRKSFQYCMTQFGILESRKKSKKHIPAFLNALFKTERLVPEYSKAEKNMKNAFRHTRKRFSKLKDAFEFSEKPTKKCGKHFSILECFQQNLMGFQALLKVNTRIKEAFRHSRKLPAKYNDLRVCQKATTEVKDVFVYTRM